MNSHSPTIKMPGAFLPTPEIARSHLPGHGRRTLETRSYPRISQSALNSEHPRASMSGLPRPPAMPSINKPWVSNNTNTSAATKKAVPASQLLPIPSLNKNNTMARSPHLPSSSRAHIRDYYGSHSNNIHPSSSLSPSPSSHHRIIHLPTPSTSASTTFNIGHPSTGPINSSPLPHPTSNPLSAAVNNLSTDSVKDATAPLFTSTRNPRGRGFPQPPRIKQSRPQIQNNTTQTPGGSTKIIPPIIPAPMKTIPTSSSPRAQARAHLDLHPQKGILINTTSTLSDEHVALIIDDNDLPPPSSSLWREKSPYQINNSNVNMQGPTTTVTSTTPAMLTASNQYPRPHSTRARQNPDPVPRGLSASSRSFHMTTFTTTQTTTTSTGKKLLPSTMRSADHPQKAITKGNSNTAPAFAPSRPSHRPTITTAAAAISTSSKTPSEGASTMPRRSGKHPQIKKQRAALSAGVTNPPLSRSSSSSPQALMVDHNNSNTDLVHEGANLSRSSCLYRGHYVHPKMIRRKTKTSTKGRMVRLELASTAALTPRPPISTRASRRSRASQAPPVGSDLDLDLDLDDEAATIKDRSQGVGLGVGIELGDKMPLSSIHGQSLSASLRRQRVIPRSRGRPPFSRASTSYLSDRSLEKKERSEQGRLTTNTSTTAHEQARASISTIDSSNGPITPAQPTIDLLPPTAIVDHDQEASPQVRSRSFHWDYWGDGPDSPVLLMEMEASGTHMRSPSPSSSLELGEYVEKWSKRVHSEILTEVLLPGDEAADSVLIVDGGEDDDLGLGIGLGRLSAPGRASAAWQKVKQLGLPNTDLSKWSLQNLDRPALRDRDNNVEGHGESTYELYMAAGGSTTSATAAIRWSKPEPFRKPWTPRRLDTLVGMPSQRDPVTMALTVFREPYSP